MNIYSLPLSLRYSYGLGSGDLKKAAKERRLTHACSAQTANTMQGPVVQTWVSASPAWVKI